MSDGKAEERKSRYMGRNFLTDYRKTMKDSILKESTNLEKEKKEEIKTPINNINSLRGFGLERDRSKAKRTLKEKLSEEFFIHFINYISSESSLLEDSKSSEVQSYQLDLIKEIFNKEEALMKRDDSWSHTAKMVKDKISAIVETLSEEYFKIENDDDKDKFELSLNVQYKEMVETLHEEQGLVAIDLIKKNVLNVIDFETKESEEILRLSEEYEKEKEEKGKNDRFFERKLEKRSVPTLFQSISNSLVKEIVFTEGKKNVNMDVVFESTTTIYTVLEALNVLKIVNSNNFNVEKALKNYNKRIDVMFT